MNHFSPLITVASTLQHKGKGCFSMLIGCMLFMASCQNEFSFPAATYNGLFPCSDCNGMAVTLQLSQDSTYRLSITRMGTAGGPTTSSGRYLLSKNGKILLKGTDTPEKFTYFEMQQDSSLRVLDTYGQPIVGEDYLLKHSTTNRIIMEAQSNPSLYGPQWKLASLDGVAPPESQTPTLLFGEDGKMSGSGGCNRFTGNYTQKNGQLQTGNIAATKMACKGDNLENPFFAALSDNNFELQLKENRLMLTSAKHTLIFVLP